MTVSASTPAYCCFSPEASEAAPLKKNAFSLSGFVIDKASDALTTTCRLKALSSEGGGAVGKEVHGTLLV